MDETPFAVDPTGCYSPALSRNPLGEILSFAGPVEAARRTIVPEQTIELAVGDVVYIGDRTLTVIDIDGDEVSFRVDEVAADAHVAYAPPPRK